MSLTSRPVTGFVDRLAAFGDRPALVAGGTTVSYAELDERVDDLGARLGDGRRLVLVEAGNTLASVVAYLAALRGGHAAMVAPPGDSALGRRLLDRYDPDVVLASDGPAAAGPRVDERRAGSRHELHPELALLLSTSGSTGSPRLVRLSAASIESNAAAIADYLRLTDADTAITSLPLHYCYGLSVLNSHLLVGATVVLSELSVVDRCFWSRARAHRVTNFAGVPHTFDLLDRIGFDSTELPSLRFVTQAGGRLHPDAVRRYADLGRLRGWELYVMYGQTEATARMAYLPPGQAAGHPGCIGVPIPGGEFRLEPVDDGVDPGVGELVYTGPNVMLGYAEQPADLARGRDVDALRTGDLARCTPAGLYEIVGRRSRFLKLFGLRVDLDASERLLADAGIEARCAGDDAGLVVAVGPGVDHRSVTDAVHRAVGLPAPAVAVVTFETVPLLPNGKVDYGAVRAARPAAAERVPAPTPADGHPAGGAVRRLYADLLDIPAGHVDDDATFVSLGGDSLTYVEMSVRLEAMLGELPTDWHVRPVGQLVPRPAGTGRRASGRRSLETTVVLRALGILAIVVSHASSLAVLGGAHLLLTVTGFNFARFQLRAIRSGGPTASLWRSIGRVAGPSVAVIALMQLAAGAFHPGQLLLTGTLTGAPTGQGLWRFWYIDVLVQLLAMAAVALAFRRVRAAEQRDPRRFAWMALGAGLLVRFDVLAVPDGAYPRFQVHNVLWLFALGWVAERCSTRRDRLAVSAVAAVALHGFFDTPSAGLVVLGGFLLLTWQPMVPAPWPLNRTLGAVAGASLFIYLTHWPMLHVPRVGAAVEVAAAVALGVTVAGVSRRLSGAFGGLWSAARRQGQERSNQRRARSAPNARFACATAGDGPSSRLVGGWPGRNVTSTPATSPAPSSK